MPEQDSVLIAIPARGGSKRLPFKNMAMVNGKPMIYYTIQAAIDSGISRHIYVCTENEEIADFSLKCGVKVFRISEEMAGDNVSSTVPCLELYKHLLSEGINIEYIFNLQPTSPLRNSEDIRFSFEKMKNEDADFLVSATEIDPHYFHWALKPEGDFWKMYFGKLYLKERTMLEPVYRPNGAIKIGKASELIKTGNVFGEKMSVYFMPEERSMHVATHFDLEFCNFCLQNIKISNK